MQMNKSVGHTRPRLWRQRLVYAALFVGLGVAGLQWANSSSLNIEPKAFYDAKTQIKTFNWQNSSRFMASSMPVVAFNAWAKPQELVAPMVTLYFYRNKPAFGDCNDIEWEVDGATIEPLGHDYNVAARPSQLSTETLRFAFSWDDLEKLTRPTAATVRLCNEHIPITQKEKLALARMLEVLMLHSVDASPERTTSMQSRQ